MSSMTVDPNRVVSEDERKALVTIEVAERLAVQAYRRIAKVRQTMVACDSPLIAGFSGELLAVQEILAAISEAATNRSGTAVKSQELSDEISAAAREGVRVALRGL